MVGFSQVPPPSGIHCNNIIQKWDTDFFFGAEPLKLLIIRSCAPLQQKRTTLVLVQASKIVKQAAMSSSLAFLRLWLDISESTHSPSLVYSLV